MSKPNWNSILMLTISILFLFAVDAQAAAPSITSLTPNTGAVGSSIVIAGSNFGSTQGSSTVKFNGTTATTTSWGASSITATVPTGATTGNVIVTVSGKASNGVTFTVTAAPSITLLTPNTGAVGSSIVIAGSNFGPSQGNGNVKFNGVSATTITSWGASSITATVPSGATTGNVVVTAAGGVASSGVTFAVTAAPSITSLTPNTGAVGSSIVIAGSNFGPSQGNGNVKFNGVSATTITSWGASSITATVPSGATTGNVVVTAAGGVASSGVPFTVTAAPSITSLTPNTGAVGSSIVIAGTNFGATQGNGGVTYNGTSATTITSWGASSITATTPSGATTGNVVVTAAGGVASSGVPFTVTAAPSITSLTPNTGAVGSSIVIAGTNFGATRGNGGVTYNGTSATTITSWGANSITATTPSGATTGNVVVTAAGGVASNGSSFTVVPPPSITTLSPTSGAVGAEVAVAGTNFGATQGSGSVSFNGTTSTPTSWSASSISVPVPSGATTGNILVRASGVASNGTSFTVVPAPTISSLSVTSGVVGAPVTITGTGFGATQGAGTVSFNGTDAAPTSWSATSIVVSVPVEATTGNVVVTAWGVASNGVNFTVFEALAITAISPTSGAVGEEVTITGTGFGTTQGGSAISLNGTTSAVGTWSDTSIVALVPSGATSGPFSVTVNSHTVNSASFTVTALPSGWSDGDIGSVGLAGSASFANGTFTVKGAGQGISGTGDAFHFVYQTLSGDGTIVARVSSMQGGQVGVMIRETLTPGSTDALVFFQPNQAYLYYRPTTGASTSTQATFFAASAYPYWVKLVRAGNSFSAYISLDGLNWTQVGTSQTITMAQNVYIGLAESSDSTSVLDTATFDNVSVTTASSPAPVIMGLSATTGSIGSQVVISGSGFGATQNGSVVTLNAAAVTINSWSSTSITITIPVGATSGPLQVSVAPSMDDSNAVTFTVTSQPLPATWLDQDVGAVGLAGSATFVNGTFTLKAAGQSIFGTADAFHFVYQALSGDGTIVARVSSLQGGQVGVMIRETLSPGSTDAFVYFQPNQAYLYYRLTPGASTSTQATFFAASAYPYWVKLTRSGSTFSAYISLDGVNWTQAGTNQTITMAQNVYIGLAESSGSTSVLDTATFDNVSVSSSSSLAPVITSLSTTTGPLGSQVVINGSGFGATQNGSVVTLNAAAVTINSWSSTSITITIPVGATSGPLQVSVAPSMNDSNAFTFTITSQPLPAAWLDQDVGAVGLAGSATFASGTFTLKGAGQSIYGTADAFHFVYQVLSGDGTIVARVSSLQGGQVGVMIRETLTASSTDAFVFFQPNQAELYYRTTTGGSTTAQPTGFTASAYPYWVKLARTGNSFSGYISLDGVNWTQIGTSQTITMAQTVCIGLAANSGSTSVLDTATFDNVSVSSTSSPAPVITSVSATTGSVGSQVVINGSSFGATQNGSVVTLNAAAVTINSWSSTSITITIPVGATSGPLQVSIAPSMNDSNAVMFAVTSQPLPTLWLDQDIGPVGATGSATYKSATFTVKGAGQGISGTADAFHFVYQAIAGDGTIIARVTSMQGGQVGVMIRETLTPGSTDALVFFQPNQAYLYYRPTTGATTSTQATFFAASAYPYWVKLARSGSTFSAYISLDGVNWTQAGTSQTITMAQNVYMGLAVSSDSSSTLDAATFDSVTLSTPSSPAPVITNLSATTGSIGSQVVITGTGFGTSQGSSAVYLTGAAVTINSWSSTSITVTIPSGAASGPMLVAVAPTMNDSNSVTFTVTSQPLPAPWLDQDIGTVGLTGSATYSGSTFTVKGAGTGISGTVDGLHFAYQAFSGDGTIIARVSNIQGSAPQVGVMIRETLASGSTDTFVYFQPNQAILNYRATTGASSSTQATTFVSSAYPYWGKLARSGNTFTGYVSTDGVYWTQVGTTQTISMAANVYIGFAVSSASTSSLATATFDNVSVISGTPAATPLVTSVSPTVVGLGYSITIAGSNFGSTQGSSVVYFNGAPATTITSWSSSQIVALVPNSATTGPVSVVANNIGSNRTVSLTIYNPVVTSIVPPFGPVGGSVVLNGSGFTPGGLGTSVVVSFNGTTETWGTVSDTSFSVNVPTGATSGPVSVSVGGISGGGVSFTIIEAASITGILPTSGLIGTTVTINGTGFGPTQSSSIVSFYGVVATAIVSWSDTQIVAIVPFSTSSGPVTVTVAGVTVQGPTFTLSTTAQVTDSLANPTTYTSQIIGGGWVMTSSQGSGCSSCTDRGTVERTYDTRGNVLTKTDELGARTTYTYDANNNVTSVSAPIAPDTYATTSYTYNSFGEVLTTTDPMGNVTTNTYDAKGNLLTVTTPAPNGNTAASVTRFTYNSLGELTQITDPLNNVTTLTYYPTGLINTITDAQQNLTTYVYDGHGNRTSVTDAMQNQTTFAYDAGDRLQTITYPGSTGTTVFGYDYRGRRTSVTDQNLKSTTYTYDDADRLLTVTDAATPANVTTYGYDTENNLTSIQDANHHTTTFAYDAFGRVMRTTFPSTLSEYYYYDAVGNLINKTDRKNQTITYTYDQLNRLTGKTYPDTTAVNYTYDNDSRLTQVTDPTGTYQFTFDNMGRLTQATTSYAFLTGRNFTTSYAYDAASNRTGFTDPENGSTGYVYDTLNRLQTLTPPAVFSGTGNFGFSYDALSRRTQMTRPNGLKSIYAYDNLSRLLSVLHQAGTSTLDGASYTVDNAGNRTSKTDQLAGVTSNYTYDPIYELTQVTQAATTTESYTYDPVGNRLSSLGVSQYVNNSSNELTSTPSTTYTYDSNGNTATKADSTGTTQYFWDFENRLSSVTLPGTGGTVSFKYDPFGRRIKKVSSAGTSIYAYDGDNLIEETNAAGAVVARYADTQNIDEPLAMLRSGATSYYHADGLGSVTSLSNSAGSLAQTYAYDSFGKQTSSSGSLINPFKFTARESDTETALYSLRARYFDAATGRFLSEDLVRFNGGASFYAYVSNSPLNFVDPFGLDKCKPNDCKNYNPYPGYRGPYRGQFGGGYTPWKVPYGPNVAAAYGDATGGPFNQNLNNVSRKFGNNTWSNCVRGCLLSAWDPCKKQYHPGFFSAHATCYVLCTGSLIGDDNMGGSSW